MIRRVGRSLLLTGSAPNPPGQSVRVVRLAIALIGLWSTASVGTFLLGGLGSSTASPVRLAPESLFLLALLAGVGAGLRFLRWHLLVVRAIGPIPPTVSVRLYLIGWALTATPARLGDLFKAQLLARYTKTAFVRSVPTVVLERLADGCALGVVLLLGAGLTLQSPNAPWPDDLALATGLGIPLLLGAFFLWAPRHARRWLQRRRSPLTAPTFAALDDLTKGSALLSRPSTLGLVLLLSCLARLGDAVLLVVVASLFDSAIPTATALLALGASGVLGGLSLLPGGAAVVEVAIASILIRDGVPPVTAFGIAFLERGCIYWGWVLIGAVALIKESLTLTESSTCRSS